MAPKYGVERGEFRERDEGGGGGGGERCVGEKGGGEEEEEEEPPVEIQGPFWELGQDLCRASHLKRNVCLSGICVSSSSHERERESFRWRN